MDAIVPLMRSFRATRFEDIPSDAVEAAKKSLLDTLGTTLAGSSAPGSLEVLALVREWAGNREASVINHSDMLPLPNAVFANAVMARALDLDDLHEKATLHSSATIVPVALGVAEYRKNVSGRSLIAAIVLGNDLTSRLALASRISPAVTGISYSYTHGIFGGAAVASRLLDLDETQMLNAMGIAYSQGVGNRQANVDGALTVRVQQGLTAKAGVVSALLAQKGITGAQNVLQGKYGYYTVFERNDYNPDVLTNNLGKQFEGRNISFKLYSCCKFTHGAIEATIEMVKKHGLTTDEIAEIRVGMNQQMFDLVCEPYAMKVNPKTIVDAQFSIYYAVASAVVRGSAFISDFKDQAIQDPKVLEVACRVKPFVDPLLEREFSTGISPTLVAIHLKSGKTLEIRIDQVRGHPQKPVSIEEIFQKYKQCASYAARPLSENQLKLMRETIFDLEKIKDVSLLLGLLKPEKSE
jgi:2-methylcitrate dehydratase PrpD